MVFGTAQLTSLHRTTPSFMALNIAPATLPSIGRYAKEIQETKDVINRQRVVLVQLVIYFV